MVVNTSGSETAGGKAPPTPTALLGARLRQARLSRNLTQSELAVNQFSVSYISAVERGQIRPSLGALEKLAARLEVPIDEFMRPDAGGAAIGGAARPSYSSASVREEIDLPLAEALVRLHQRDGESALRILRGLPSKGLSPREETLVAWRTAEALRQLARADEARARAQEALALAERVGDPELRERVRFEVGRTLALAGQPRAALEVFDACRVALDQGAIFDPIFAMDVLFALGEAQREAGSNEAAIATLAEAAALAETALAPERLGERYWTLSAHHHNQRDARRARLYAARSLVAYEDAANRRLAARMTALLGRAYAAVGRDEEAVAQLEAALARAQAVPDAAGVAEAQAALASIHVRQGRTEEAARAAEQAIDFAATVDDPALAAEAQIVLAQVLEARGDEAGAKANFEQALERLRSIAATTQLGDAYAQYSQFLERHGDNKHALEFLKQAWILRERATADA